MHPQNSGGTWFPVENIVPVTLSLQQVGKRLHYRHNRTTKPSLAPGAPPSKLREQKTWGSGRPPTHETHGGVCGGLFSVLAMRVQDVGLH